jgi:predicted esterase
MGLKSGRMIGVGAGYRSELYHGLSDFKVHAIHGAEDEVILIAQARADFEKITTLRFGYEFHELAGVGHTLNDEGRQLLRGLIEREFGLSSTVEFG